MSFISRLDLKHSIGIYLIAIFLSLVLFNTTYMSLGTIVPLVVILMIVLYVVFNAKYKNNIFTPFIGYLVVITLSTIVMEGEIRILFKIIANVLTVFAISKLRFSINEAKFFSLIISVTYCIYALLVIKSIGMEWRDYGRIQIAILNSDIPLDPNVISANFILPSIIALYNLFYGKRKILAIGVIIIFVIAIISTGSRGAFISLSLTSSILVGNYIFDRNNAQNIFVKVLFIFIVIFAVLYAITFISQQDNLTGLDRLVDYSDGSNGRVDIWKEKLTLLLDSPILGYGINHDIGLYGKKVACHNTFIEVLFYGGVLGLFIFFIPIVNLYKRNSFPRYLKIVLFLSVCLPICGIDSLQERTLWNFFIYYEIISRFKNAKECLLWNYK